MKGLWESEDEAVAERQGSVAVAVNHGGSHRRRCYLDECAESVACAVSPVREETQQEEARRGRGALLLRKIDGLRVVKERQE